jgi:hypothetical protein
MDYLARHVRGYEYHGLTHLVMGQKSAGHRLYETTDGAAQTAPQPGTTWGCCGTRRYGAPATFSSLSTKSQSEPATSCVWLCQGPVRWPCWLTAMESACSSPFQRPVRAVWIPRVPMRQSLRGPQSARHRIPFRARPILAALVAEPFDEPGWVPERNMTATEFSPAKKGAQVTDCDEASAP